MSAATEESGVVQWMRTTVDAYEKLGGRFKPLEGWVLKHGAEYGPRIDLPEGVSYMEAKLCFGNAFTLAAYDERFLYVEGFAYTPGLMAVHHAWVVDDRGRVVDPTWMDGGKVCAFCLGEKTKSGEVCEKCETWADDCPHSLEDLMEIGTYEDERPCWSCNGSGEAEFEHPSREGCSYYGVSVPKDKLIAMVLKKGSYGVLPDCIGELET